MRELFFKLFEMSHFDTGIKVTAFSVPHIIYLIIISGAIVGLYLGFRRAPYEKKKKLLDILVILITVSYLSDFFIHEFAYATEADGVLTGGGMIMDKLPFHICVVLCPIAVLVQFNKRLYRFIEPVALLAAIAPMMYLAYPASIGEGEPWCYQAVQTMFYHGTLMAYGILNLALGTVKPNIKKCYSSAILLIGITLWAKLGNILYDGHNWFFLEEDAFYIGLVEGGILPKWSLMLINPIVFFMAVLAFYGVYYLVVKLKTKKTTADFEIEQKEELTV